MSHLSNLNSNSLSVSQMMSQEEYDRPNQQIANLHFQGFSVRRPDEGNEDVENVLQFLDQSNCISIDH